MNVEPLSLGPIVGATTASSARVWGRGALEATEDGCPRRSFGVARIKAEGGRFGAPIFFPMSPTFDVTGVVVFEGLAPETRQICEMGWFFAEAELGDLKRAMRLDWSAASRASFRTGSDDPAASRSIVLGSCRYLLRLGGTWFDRRGDKTFRSILEQIDAGRETHALLMMGDQIYADDLAFAFPDRIVDDYLARYRDAFGQPAIRELMSRVPTYMILDDHEIEDAWPKHASPVDWMVKYPAAIHAYQVYQASHGPLFETDAARIRGIPDKLWYRFTDGCCDVFVMDVRTERFLSEDPDADQMVSTIQMEALKDWLVDGSGRVKLVVTPVPLFPDTLGKGDDHWSGFPRQRDEILAHVADHGVERVVVLSGDVHASFSSELRGIAGTRAKLVSIVSSPFYWPYPHMPSGGIVLEGMWRAGEHTFELAEAGPVVSTDNFSRLDVHPDRVELAVYGRKGEPLGPPKVHWLG